VFEECAGDRLLEEVLTVYDLRIRKLLNDTRNVWAQLALSCSPNLPWSQPRPTSRLDRVHPLLTRALFQVPPATMIIPLPLRR
jgi:hypothetical protein